jgi:glutaminyl-peptide cyclotransferase
MDPTPTILSTIEHLVLLDLLGAVQPRVMQWYKETGWLFKEMRSADVRLRESRVGVFGEQGKVGGGGAEWFSQLSFGGSIEDDQVPVSHSSRFLLMRLDTPPAYRVPNVLIPTSNCFVACWHSLSREE